MHNQPPRCYTTIVNNDITRSFELEVSYDADWQSISDAISRKEGYSDDELPDWKIVWERASEWGIRLAEMVNRGYSIVVILRRP